MIGVSQESIDKARNIVLLVTGGIGRNIMATAVVRNLKKAYPKKRIVVVCGYPDIYLQNPHVYRTYGTGNTIFFYEDFIKDSESIVLNVEPYHHPDYVYKRKHFVECWCEMLGIPCDSVYPEMFFTDNELKLAEAHMVTYDKDLVMCHFEGGKVPEGADEKNRLIARNAMYARSIKSETQVKIVDALNMLNYRVGVVGHPNQYKPGCCDKIEYNTRAIIAMIPFAKYIIAIDSFLLHASACFKKPVIALWAGTSPITLGYPNDINIRRNVCETPECHRPNSFLFDITTSGYAWECPVNNICCDHSAEEVLKEFEKITGGKRGEPRKSTVSPVVAVGVNPYEGTAPQGNGNGAGKQDIVSNEAQGVSNAEGFPSAQVQ